MEVVVEEIIGKLQVCQVREGRFRSEGEGIGVLEDTSLLRQVGDTMLVAGAHGMQSMLLCHRHGIHPQPRPGQEFPEGSDFIVA